VANVRACARWKARQAAPAACSSKGRWCRAPEMPLIQRDGAGALWSPAANMFFGRRKVRGGAAMPHKRN